MQTEVLIIGGGQAGLAASYYLQQSRISSIILDRNDAIGDEWRNRYDSLTLFTPRAYSQLPGMKLPGDPDQFAGKNEIADALQQYASHNDLSIRSGTEVVYLSQERGGFTAHTNRGDFSARQVIIATGPFQKPNIPVFSRQLDPNVTQLHSAAYRNPSDLGSGTVLVVGSGNSGAQIAVELARSHRVFVATGHRLTHLPLEVAGKSIFWWFDKLGILNAPSESWLSRRIRRRPDPIFGLDFKRLVKSGHIMLTNKANHAAGRNVFFADGTSLAVDHVVWATGFRSDYGWLNVPEALDGDGKPIHRRGVSPVEGLYYVGLPWQSSRNSALLGGVGRDAEIIVKHITNKIRS